MRQFRAFVFSLLLVGLCALVAGNFGPGSAARAAGPATAAAGADDDLVSGLKTFTFQLGEAVGTGPFFNVLLQNIVPATLTGQTPLSPGAPR